MKGAYHHFEVEITASSSTRIRTIAIEVTKRCPLHCLYCYNPTRNGGEMPELNTSEWLRVIRKLPKLETGIITGGEPLLRKDIFTLIRAFIRKCDNSILLTSGQKMDDEIVGNLLKLNITVQIQISELGLNYDKNTASEGAFDTLEQAIILLDEHDVSFTTSIVMTKRNLDRLKSILAFHSAAGSAHILAIRYVPQYDHEIWRELILGPEEYITALGILDNFSRKNNIPVSLGIPNLPCIIDGKRYKHLNMPDCSAGKNYFTIDESGRAKFCPHHLYPGPSLLEVSLDEAVMCLLEHGKETFELPDHCNDCSYGDSCNGGCRGSAYSLGGKGGGADPMLLCRGT